MFTFMLIISSATEFWVPTMIIAARAQSTREENMWTDRKKTLQIRATYVTVTLV